MVIEKTEGERGGKEEGGGGKAVEKVADGSRGSAIN